MRPLIGAFSSAYNMHVEGPGVLMHLFSILSKHCTMLYVRHLERMFVSLVATSITFKQ